MASTCRQQGEGCRVNHDHNSCAQVELLVPCTSDRIMPAGSAGEVCLGQAQSCPAVLMPACC